MKLIAMLMVAGALFGCGQDQQLLMDTKFDAPLRQKIAAIRAAEGTEALTILGMCDNVIDGPMRQALVGAGADVQVMRGDTFTANVSSEDVFSVAALEFVKELRLSGITGIPRR